MAVKNEASADTTVTLRADVPAGFTTTFKEGYNTQEITSLVIKANESKDITVSVKPGPRAPAGPTPVKLTIAGEKTSVETKLTADISGAPTVNLSGADERLSGDAYAGQERSVQMILRNTGTAAATGIALSATPPSGWKVTFDPKEINSVEPGGEAKFAALITPAAQAISGDYVVSVRASGDGISETANYRLSVLTSTLWGVTGLLVIGAALLVLIGAVTRFGRR